MLIANDLRHSHRYRGGGGHATTFAVYIHIYNRPLKKIPSSLGFGIDKQLRVPQKKVMSEAMKKSDYSPARIRLWYTLKSFIYSITYSINCIGVAKLKCLIAKLQWVIAKLQQGIAKLKSR